MEYPYKRIWLQYDPSGQETTWCQDKINDDDFEFVSAALLDQMGAALRTAYGELAEGDSRLATDAVAEGLAAYNKHKGTGND